MNVRKSNTKIPPIRSDWRKAVANTAIAEESVGKISDDWLFNIQSLLRNNFNITIREKLTFKNVDFISQKSVVSCIVCFYNGS